MSQTWNVKDVGDLNPVVQYLQTHLRVGDIVLLHGEVGAGKTTLVNRLVSAWGGPDSNSPTFAIHNAYQTADTSIHHLDLYRLESAEEIYSAGVEDFLADKNAILFIEWAERLAKGQLPRGRRVFELTIRLQGDQRTFLWREI
jgi:tRNA threonylcarbamoyladenosine biosynthesis protein TsaE